MPRRFALADLWLPLVGALVAGGITAELVTDLDTGPGVAAPAAATFGDWPGRPADGPSAVGLGDLPAGILPAATGMMAALETWRGARYREDVQLRVVDGAADGPWGQYDAARHILAVRRDAPLGAMTLVHELCHALQDQHAALGARPLPATDDAALAWRALVEGEATLAGAELTGVSLDGHGGLPGRRHLGEAEARTLFLYMDGARFVQAVQTAEGWAGVDRAWESPPSTTVEILSPELYLRGAALLPPDALGPGTRAGAFALWRALGHTATGRAEGRTIASAWRGDARDADADAGTWRLALVPPADERLVALAPAALAAAGLPAPRATLLSPGRVELGWGGR